MKRPRWWYWWIPVHVVGALLVAGCGSPTHGTVQDKRISGLDTYDLLIVNMGAKGERGQWVAVPFSQYEECQVGDEWNEETGC